MIADGAADTVLVLSILSSVGLLAAEWFKGTHSPWGPGLGLATQVPYAGLILATGAHGLWLSWVPMTAIHVRNLVRWRRDRRARLVNSVDATDADLVRLAGEEIRRLRGHPRQRPKNAPPSR
jgi:hypothetical protein